MNGSPPVENLDSLEQDRRIRYLQSRMTGVLARLQKLEGQEDAKSPGSEEASGESGGDSEQLSVEEDRLPDSRGRPGNDEIHISHKQGSDNTSVAHVPGVGAISVQGTMSIRGQGLQIHTYPDVDVVSYRSG